VGGAQSLSAAGHAKEALRKQVLAARAAMTPSERAAQAAAAVDALLAHCPTAAGELVAVYASFGTEPATEGLRAALAGRGNRLLLPAVLADKDLSWVDESGVDRGVGAIGDCALVVLPGRAGDLSGHRLGRGAGCYDRALRRVPDHVPRVLLLYRDELVERVPAEPHDALVTHLALPDGVRRTSAWLGA
jgi:5-formyltetrahydrofolate cyclo-ligase